MFQVVFVPPLAANRINTFRETWNLQPGTNKNVSAVPVEVMYFFPQLSIRVQSRHFSSQNVTLMDWLYRLQARIAITRTETVALAALSGLFLTGLLIQHVWETKATVPDDYYAETDSLFEAYAAQLGDDTAARASLVEPDTSDSPEDSSDSETAVRMNLNAANARQLQQLSGIGPVLADRIVTYRQTNGPFTSVDDLVEVSGIGSKTLEDIRDMLYVETAPSDDP